MAYMKFKGTYHHGLDAKNRMFIPVKYREALGENFVIIRAPYPNKGLYAFPEETWDELCDEMNEKSAQGVLSQEEEWERRDLYRYSDDVSMDKQGRITINQDLCEYAGLKNEVIIIGNMKHLEIWDPETFAKAEEESHNGRVVGTPKLNF